jgi:hypothetical protein
MKKQIPPPIHPFLIGLYPVLSLYYLNIGEISLPAIQRALLTSFIIIAGISLLFLAILQTWDRSALPISFTLIMVLTYGHFYNLFEGASIGELTVGRHRFLFPTWVGILIFGNHLTINRIKGTKWTSSLNTISGIMIALIVGQVGIRLYQANAVRQEVEQTRPSTEFVTEGSVDRDIYYILLDAYSREDLLKEKFNLDISPFISELESMGFYVPRCAQGNYFNTYPSMTATLNMNYLNVLGIDVTSADETTYAPFIHQNAVRRSFEDLGYQTVTFKGLYPTIDIPDSNYYFDYFEKNSSIGGTLESLNFQYLFLKTTALLPLIEYLETSDKIDVPDFLAAWMPVGNANNSREYRQYQQSVFALDTLKSLPNLPGKKFVYAHLFITHQPFVFYPDGQFHDSLPQDNAAYRDQVIFANKAILEIVKSLLENSETKPIIIIQSDHSYLQGKDRVKILNAYYLPDGGKAYLYETITPVNTFRIIFNAYFNGEYPLLPDISTYMTKKVGKVRYVEVAPSTCTED